MRIAVPDLVSNSYFPAAAAAVLGHYAAEGLNLEVVHISPVEACLTALRDGAVAFVGASAHAPLLAFPGWQGAKLVCAQSQGMYWFLVMHRDLGIARGDLAALAGRRIAAVPFTAAALRRVLAAGGVDPVRDGIDIVVPPAARQAGVNFGVAAARALAAREIDGFFANGMGAALAVAGGSGDIVLDLRGGDGPAECFSYTMPAIATTDRMIADRPEAVAAAVRAIVRTQQALRADLDFAARVAEKLFPPRERELICDVVARDLPYYRAEITPPFVAAMNRFARDIGLLKGSDVAYDGVVAAAFAGLWQP